MTHEVAEPIVTANIERAAAMGAVVESFIKQKPAVFFDIDGVLADFVLGAMLRHGRTDIPYEHIRWQLWDQFHVGYGDFWAAFDREFWAGLRPYKDGFNLLAQAEEMVGPEKIALLTVAGDAYGSMDGKRDWVAEHLPAYSDRLFNTLDKGAYAEPNTILVDDRDEFVDSFGKAGGWVVHVPRPWNLRREDTIGGGRFSVPQVREELAEVVRLASR